MLDVLSSPCKLRHQSNDFHFQILVVDSTSEMVWETEYYWLMPGRHALFPHLLRIPTTHLLVLLETSVEILIIVQIINLLNNLLNTHEVEKSV